MSHPHADYWTALEHCDRHLALDAVRRMLDERDVTALELVREIVIPAQARIGELWEAGEWTVAQEHAATAINEGLIHYLCSFSDRPGDDRPLVVVSCLEREQHSLPALVVAEAVLDAGYRVHYVGGDPDADDLVRHVLLLKPRAVLFSGSLTSSLARQKALFEGIGTVGIPVIVGGSAFGSDDRRAMALGATAYAADIEEALRLLEVLPERSAPVQASAPTPADLEARWLMDYRHEISPFVARSLVARHPRDQLDWAEEVHGYVDHVIGCLASALVTGDETIMIEVHGWLARVATAREGDARLVDDLWELLGEPLRGHPQARVHLAGAAVPLSDGSLDSSTAAPDEPVVPEPPPSRRGSAPIEHPGEVPLTRPLRPRRVGRDDDELDPTA